MNVADSTEPKKSETALSENDAQRVVALLDAAGEVHPDLWAVLAQPDPDRVLDEVFSDEIHAQHA